MQVGYAHICPGVHNIPALLSSIYCTSIVCKHCNGWQNGQEWLADYHSIFVFLFFFPLQTFWVLFTTYVPPSVSSSLNSIPALGLKRLDQEMIVGIVRVPSNPPLVFFFLSYLNFSSFFLPLPSSSFSFLADQSSSLIQPLVHAKLDKISSDQGPFTPSILSPILPSKIQSTSQPGQSYEMYAGTYPVIFTCRCTCKMHVHILHTFTCGYLNKS